jgi:hypothetical protein
MKISELLLELHTLMLEKGNLDVFVIDDGLIEDPYLNIRSKRPHTPAGVYLN